MLTRNPSSKKVKRLCPTTRDEIHKADLANISMLRLVVYATRNETWISDTIEFIALFSQLTHLRLHFKNRGEDRASGSLCRRLNVNNLHELELSRLIVTESELMDVLLRHQKSLKQVTLEQIEFDTPEGWPSFLSRAKDELSSCTFILVTSGIHRTVYPRLMTTPGS